MQDIFTTFYIILHHFTSFYMQYSNQTALENIPLIKLFQTKCLKYANTRSAKITKNEMNDKKNKRLNV